MQETVGAQLMWGLGEGPSVDVLFQLSPDGVKDVKSRKTVPDRGKAGLRM